MKRGTKEPEGSEDWPTGIHGKTFSKTDKPCWWSENGHTHESFGIRAKKTCGTRKFRENYDKIKWDK